MRAARTNTHECDLPGAGAFSCPPRSPPPPAPAVGKALAFTSAMTALVKKFPSQDNGVAFVFQGSYFLAAPWPVRSPRKALACYEKAVLASIRKSLDRRRCCRYV